MNKVTFGFSLDDKLRPGQIFRDPENNHFYILARNGDGDYVAVNLASGHYWRTAGTIDEAVDNLVMVADSVDIAISPRLEKR